MALTLSMTSTPLAADEPGLVAAARAGDDRAFGELYARYQPRISAFIFSKVRDHGRAEDVTQEVFISALRRLRKCDQEIAFKPWIYEIAKNACIDEFRRTTRTHEVPLETDDDFAGAKRGLLSVAPTPVAAVESKQRLDDLRGAFGGLSESHHKLLVMREFEGRSYDEIGNQLGMTRQMVESGLFRARRKLTDEYAELASGRRCEEVQTAIEARPASSLRALGIRERRRFSRHLAHCQTCRHKARLAGVDEALVQPRSVTKKIAALLPFPLWRWRWRWPWRGARGGGTAAAGSGSHHLAAVGSLQSAARIAEPASSSVTLGQAAAAAAALAIAGAGGGIVSGLNGHHHANHHATVAPAAARAATRAPAAASHAPASTASRAAAPAVGGGATQAGRRSELRLSHSARIAHVSSARAVPGSTATASSATASSATTPAAGSAPSRSTQPAGGVTVGALPTPVKASTVTGAVHSTVSGAVKSTGSGAVSSTVSAARHVVAAASQSVLSAAPVAGSTSAVQSTVQNVLSGPTSASPPSPDTASTPAQTLKSAVSSLLPN